MVTAKKAGAPARAAGAARATDPKATKSGARGPASGPARGASRGATPSRSAHSATRKDGRPNPQRAGTERPPPVDLDGAFRLLKAVLERHVHSLQVLFNTPENYTLGSRRLDPKGMPREFGVLLKLKTHVSFKLLPLAQFPELAAALPPELKARMQGKAAFSFERPEPELVGALDALVRTAHARLRSAGLA